MTSFPVVRAKAANPGLLPAEQRQPEGTIAEVAD